MERDFRYKIEHMGDSVADLLEKVPSAIKVSFDFMKKFPATAKKPMSMIKKVSKSAKDSARGVILTYDIHDLKKKRKKLIKKIGNRLLELRKEDTELNVANDETLISYFSNIDKVESQLNEDTKERHEMLYPAERIAKSLPEETKETTPEETKETTEESLLAEEGRQADEGKISPESTTEVSIEEPLAQEKTEAREVEIPSEAGSKMEEEEPSREEPENDDTRDSSPKV